MSGPGEIPAAGGAAGAPKGNAKTLRQKGRAMTMLRKVRRIAAAHRRCNSRGGRRVPRGESLRYANGGTKFRWTDFVPFSIAKTPIFPSLSALDEQTILKEEDPNE